MTPARSIFAGLSSRAWFILLPALCCIGAPAMAQFAGGDGTAADPWQIATPAQLDQLRDYLGPDHVDKHFVLVSDIDLRDFAEGEGWVPIGGDTDAFSGHLEGDGYVVRHLTIDRPDHDHQGLFGHLDGATVRGLGLEEVVLAGGDLSGALAGRAVATRIEQVHVTGQIQGGDDTGGLAGLLDGVTALSAGVEATVVGQQDTGGLAGRIVGDSRLLFVYTLGSVTATGAYAGGLAGQIAGGALSNAYSHAGVTGTTRVGGLVGQLDSGSSLQWVYTTGTVAGTGSFVSVIVGLANGTIASAYCDLESSGQPSSSDCVDNGSTTAEMQQRETYAKWNFFTVWNIDEGNDYPVFQALDHHALPQAVDVNDLDGSGTVEDPWIITTADELNAMRQDLSAHYRLSNDIDLAATVIWNDGQGWEPIGDNADRFTGSLDGNGYTVHGLSIKRPDTQYQGLFGYLQDAVIERLMLDRVDVLGGQYTGAVTGWSADASRIKRVEVTGVITATGSRVGGVVGQLTGSSRLAHARFAGHVTGIKGTSWSYTGGLVGGTHSSARIVYSLSSGVVEGSGRTGGLVGNHGASSIIADSYSKALVSGADHVGGLAGRMDGSFLRINRSYAAGPVNGTSDVGGLVGSRAGGSVIDSYWDTEVTGQPTSVGGGEGKTTVEMQQRATYEGWNFFTRWEIDEGNNYPVFRDVSGHEPPEPVDLEDLDGEGTVGDPWIITSADELNAIRQDLAAHYRLGNDIDLTASVTWHDDEGWEPVGPTFTGSLDADGHAIRNMTIDRPDAEFQGLFGALGDDAVVSDLVLENVHVRGDERRGALAGRGRGTIAGVRVSGEIEGTRRYSGGMVGDMICGSVINSHAAVAIRGGAYTGGLIGYAQCSTLTIENSYSLGTVNGTDYTGGLIGELAFTTLVNSYSRAQVSGSSDVGGLVGRSSTSSSVIGRSYSTGAVSGSGNDIGGLVGSVGTGDVINSYWDTETSGQDESAGGEGRTTAEMQQQATYIGWDFTDTWSIVEDITYPDLQQTARAIALDRNGRLHTSAASADHGFSVLANTAWTASSTEDWITVTDTTGGVVGDESGTVTYIIEASPSPDIRTGTITVTDGNGIERHYSVQQGTILDIKPAGDMHDATASAGHAVNVTGNTEWTASSDADWLIVTDGAIGTGDGQAHYRVAPNTSLNARDATLTVTGGGIERDHVVVQRGALPVLTIDPHWRDHSAAASVNHQIEIIGNIDWSAATTDDWLTLTDGGDDFVVYAVDANPLAEERTGMITVSGGQRSYWFLVVQAPARSIGGTVSGLLGSGLVLQNNGADDLVIEDDGPFEFDTALPDGEDYLVTVLTQPQSPNQTCEVFNGSGTVSGDDITDVEVVCTTDSYTVTTTAINGTITSPVDPVVEYGQTTTVEGQADDHHYFASVAGCDGDEQTNDDQSVTEFVYETGEIVAHCTVSAEFAIKSYAITATVAQGEGSVEVLTEQVEHGDDAVFEVTADNGWSLASFTGDTCTPIDNSDGTWTAENITEDCAVEAIFIEDTELVLASSVNPAYVDEPVTYTITVTGTDSAPADGQIELVSDQDGLLCSLDTPDSVSGNSAVFACEHTWNETGTHELTATFSGSETHGDSADTYTQNIVADEFIFRDRFEADPSR